MLYGQVAANLIHTMGRCPSSWKRPPQSEISAYMRLLVEKRWQKYRLRVARGEITAENYVYRPRGPMPAHSKARQALTRLENQIAKARLVRLALEGTKLSARQIEADGGDDAGSQETASGVLWTATQAVAIGALRAKKDG